MTVSVYGLGTLDAGFQCPGITATEVAAHRALLRLSDRLTNLEGWLPAGAWAETSWRPYQPEALRLVVRNADADPADGSGIGNGLVDWPDSSNPVTFGDVGPFDGQRCGVVSGQRAEDWYAALSAAQPADPLREGRPSVRGDAPPAAPRRAAGVPQAPRLSRV